MPGGATDTNDATPRATARRGLVFAAALALGVLLARTLHLESFTVPFLIAAAFGALAWTLPTRAAQWSLALGAAALGAGWCALRVHNAPADALERRLDAFEPRLVTVEGVLRRDPEVIERRGALARFSFPTPGVRLELRADTFLDSDGAPHRANGLLYTRVDGTRRPDTLRAGDRVRISGWATRVAPPDNPGATDMRPWAAQERIAGWSRVPAQGLVTRAEHEPTTAQRLHARWLRFRADARATANASLTRAADAHLGWGSDESDAILRAILLGEREHTLQDVHETFTRLGLAHVLAVSGLHLGIAAWLLLIVLRACGAGAMRWEAPLVALLVLAYLFLVPVRTPIVRAAIMTIVFLGAEASGRRYDRLNILGWAMAITLLWKPLDLFSPGFQLSYLCVGALIAFTRPVRERCFGPPPQRDAVRAPRRAWEGAKDALCASLVAWVVATPVVAHHFGVVAPLGVPLSLLGVPVAAVALALGFLAMLAGAIAPPVLTLIAPLLHAPLALSARAAAWIDSAPWSALHVPHLGALATIAGVVVGAEWLRRGALARRAWRLHAATALLALWLALLWVPNPIPRDVALRIDVLSVGDGTCILVRTRDSAVLWDIGSSRLNIGEREVPEALRALGARRVRTLVISHPDLDHYAGAIDAAKRLGVRELVVGEAFPAAARERPDGPVAFTLRTLESRGVRTRIVHEGDAIPLPPLRAEVLWPPAREPGAPEPARASNDESIVLRIAANTEAGERAILLTGDAERDVMRALLEHPHRIRADIVEAPHHGSAVHAHVGVPFLRAADPRIVLQSSSRARLDDDRWAPARDNRHWRITARDGALWAEILHDGTIRTGAPRAPTITLQK